MGPIIATFEGMFMLDRRLLLGLMMAAAIAPTKAKSQQPGNRLLKRVRTGTLEIAYEDSGPEAGFPVLLMHGFPYDPRSYDEVVPRVVAAGYRAIVPYLRGYGATRFLAAESLRSGQQAAFGRDLLDLMDALNLPRRRSSASTGAGGPRPWSRRCGPSVCVAPC